MQMRSSNPMLNVDRIVDIGRKAGLTGVSETLSVRGTAGKFGILAGLCMISAFGTVAMHLPYAVAMVGLLVATICYFAACFVPRLAPALSVVYAVGEGMCLGLISAFAESRYPGVVMVALAATLSVCVAMFLAFATGFISATQKLKAFLSIASLGSSPTLSHSLSISSPATTSLQQAITRCSASPSAFSQSWSRHSSLSGTLTMSFRQRGRQTRRWSGSSAWASSQP